ncbi:hypothetical protein Tco_0741668, partial [Tanacetum coccineum]
VIFDEKKLGSSKEVLPENIGDNRHVVSVTPSPATVEKFLINVGVEQPADTATEAEKAAFRAEYKKHFDVACIMLGKMSPALQRQNLRSGADALIVANRPLTTAPTPQYCYNTKGREITSQKPQVEQEGQKARGRLREKETLTHHFIESEELTSDKYKKSLEPVLHRDCSRSLILFAIECGFKNRKERLSYMAINMLRKIGAMESQAAGLDACKGMFEFGVLSEVHQSYRSVHFHITLLKSIPPGIDDDNLDPEGEIHLVERLLYDNSSLRPPEELNVENSIESFSPPPIPVEDSDSLMEEIDLFLTPEDSMSPGIENDGYDSEGDILFLKELLSNDSPSLPENESFHFDIPSSPRPPAKPPDDGIYFEPDTGLLTTTVVGNISEHYVLMPKLLPTQPTLCPVNDTLIPFSSENEDKVHFLSHRGFKAFSFFLKPR